MVDPNFFFNISTPFILPFFTAEKVIGAGTTVDSARFRQLIAKKTDEPIESVTGMVLGEHGENAIPIWSSVTVMGGKTNNHLKGLLQDNSQKVTIGHV